MVATSVIENASSMHAIGRKTLGETQGGNSLRAGNVWAWGNYTLSGETYITVTCGLVHCYSDMCAGKNGSLGICVWGMQSSGKHIYHCDRRTSIKFVWATIGKKNLIDHISAKKEDIEI